MTQTQTFVRRFPDHEQLHAMPVLSRAGWSTSIHPKNAAPETAWLFYFRSFKLLNWCLISRLLRSIGPCGEPSVFKVFRWWSVCYLESALHRAGGCKGTVLYQSLSTIVVFCVHPGFLKSAFIFLRMHWTIDLTTPNVPTSSLMNLFCFYSVRVTLSWELLWTHNVGSQQQLPNKNDILGIQFKPLTSLKW